MFFSLPTEQVFNLKHLESTHGIKGSAIVILVIVDAEELPTAKPAATVNGKNPAVTS